MFLCLLGLKTNTSSVATLKRRYNNHNITFIIHQSGLNSLFYSKNLARIDVGGVMMSNYLMFNHLIKANELKFKLKCAQSVRLMKTPDCEISGSSCGFEKCTGTHSI